MFDGNLKKLYLQINVVIISTTKQSTQLDHERDQFSTPSNIFMQKVSFTNTIVYITYGQTECRINSLNRHLSHISLCTHIHTHFTRTYWNTQTHLHLFTSIFDNQHLTAPKYSTEIYNLICSVVVRNMPRRKDITCKNIFCHNRNHILVSNKFVYSKQVMQNIRCIGTNQHFY